MKLPLTGLNNYLMLILLAAVLAGCASSEERKKRKQETAVQLFLESEFDTGDKTQVVPVYRNAPVPVRVYKAPLLDNADLVSAAVLDVVGGFAIQLTFNFHGRIVLEGAANSNRDARLVVCAIYPEVRWLAAPKMTGPISNGMLAFTPDATREEAERIVRGLNNVAIRLGNQSKPGKKKTPDEKSS